jgi:replicative DNA helicase
MEPIPPEIPFDPPADSPKDEAAVDTLAGSSLPKAPLTPHNREAEEAVVGAVLINPEIYYDLAEFLQPDDFYIVRHRWIWEAFRRLHERRVPLDFLTLTEELDNAGQLEEIGGPAYLTTLINQVPTSLHAVAYGHMVESTALRRRLVSAANEVASLAYNEGETIDNVMEGAEKSIFNVSERRLKKEMRPIELVLDEFYDRIEKLARRPEDMFGVPTGFIDLDRKLTGMQPSDLLIIAGRPGQGKSGFLLTVARNAALLHKKKVAIFSLEMSSEQVIQRLLAQETGIDSQRLRNGKLTPEEWPLLIQAIDVLGDTHIYLDDTPALTPMALRTKCRRLQMEFGIDLVLLDYIQLMGGDTRTDNRVQEVSYISRNLKVLARELNVPVLAAAQLNRAVEQRTDKRPVLSDLRESGSLEQDADIVMFIYRADQYLTPDQMEKKSDSVKPNVAEIIIAKHRNGPTGSIELIFQEHLARFVDGVTKNIDFSQV